MFFFSKNCRTLFDFNKLELITIWPNRCLRLENSKHIRGHHFFI